MAAKTSDLITHTEAGRIAGVSRIAVWKWRKAGKLKSYVIGSRAFVSRREVEQLARNW